jgi:hypothetical protein
MVRNGGVLEGQRPDEEERSQRNSDVVEALIDDQMLFLMFKDRWQGLKVQFADVGASVEVESMKLLLKFLPPSLSIQRLKLRCRRNSRNQRQANKVVDDNNGS